MNLHTFISDYARIVFDNKEFTQNHLNEAIKLALPESKLALCVFTRRNKCVSINDGIVTLNGVHLAKVKTEPFPVEETLPPAEVKTISALMKRLGVIDNILESIELAKRMQTLSS